MYIVFYVGESKSGKWKDGETLYIDDNPRRVAEFAREFQEKNSEDFHEVWGGVSIALDDGTPVEW